MSTRETLRELLTCDESAFPSAARSFLAAHDKMLSNWAGLQERVNRR